MQTRARLRTEVVADLGALRALAPAWHQLLLTSPEATAFASPAWVISWYEHFESPGGIHVVTVWRGTELVGIAPFARTRVGGRRAGFSLLVSAGTEHGDYGEPLCGSDPVPVARAIVDHLCELVSGEAAAVNLRRLYDHGPVLAELAHRSDVHQVPMGERADAAVVRFSLMDEPGAALDKAARKRDIHRRERRLREQYTKVEMRGSDANIDAALVALRSFLDRRFEAGTGPRAFASPRRAAFTRASTHALIDAGLARMSTICADGRPVAVSLCQHVGDRWVGDLTGFDVDLPKLGLGQMMIFEVLRHALEEGASEIDMRAGHFPYKDDWANATRTSRSVALVARGGLGQLQLALRRPTMSYRARHMKQLERKAR